MEDIKQFTEEITDLGASITDAIIAYALLHHHKPELLLSMIGKGMVITSTMDGFDEYVPKMSGIIHSLNREELAQFIADVINENKGSHEINIPSPLGGYMAQNINCIEDIEDSLNALIDLRGKVD